MAELIRKRCIVLTLDAATRAAIGGFKALSILERLDPEETVLMAYELRTIEAALGAGLKEFLRALVPFFNRVAEQIYRHQGEPVFDHWTRQLRDASRLLAAEKLVGVRQERKHL